MSSVVISGDTSGSVTLSAPSTAGSSVLTLPVGTATITANGLNSNIVAGTAVASTSGTSITFSSIPSWVKRITVMFNGVSTSGTSFVQVQLGAGSVTTTGYKSAAVINNNANTGYSTYTSGFGLESGASSAATTNRYGQMIISLLGSNTWVYSYNGWLETYGFGGTASGSVTLSGTLDRVVITTVNGTDTFDAGSINILYE